MMLRHTVSLALLVFHLNFGASFCAEADYKAEFDPPRKALVIGITKYKELKEVPSGIIDAKLLGEKLESLSPPFKVTYSYNENKKNIEDKIRIFVKSLTEDDVAIVYFSGHGFQFEGLNYLATQDTPKPIPGRAIANFAIPVDAIVNYIEVGSPSFTLVILDACRDSSIPIDDKGKLKGEESNGMHMPKLPPPQIVMGFATYFGQTAQSGLYETENSLYTKHLIKNLGRPGADFHKIFQLTGKDVIQDKLNKSNQLPVVHSVPAGDFYPNPTNQVNEITKMSWMNALTDGNRQDIVDFRFLNPASRFSRAARLWLNTNTPSEEASNVIVDVESTKKITWTSRLDEYGENKLVHYTSVDIVERRNNKLEFFPADSKFLSGSGDTTARTLKDVEVFDAPDPKANPIGGLTPGRSVNVIGVQSWHPYDKTWLKVEIPSGGEPPSVGYIRRYDALTETVRSYRALLYGSLAPTTLETLLRNEVSIQRLDRIDTISPGKSQNTSLVTLPETLKSVLGANVQFNLQRTTVAVEIAQPAAETEGESRRLAFLRSLQVKNKLLQAGLLRKNITVNVTPVKNPIQNDKITIIVN
jgi:hypothetical protein